MRRRCRGPAFRSALPQCSLQRRPDRRRQAPGPQKRAGSCPAGNAIMIAVSQAANRSDHRAATRPGARAPGCGVAQSAQIGGGPGGAVRRFVCGSVVADASAAPSISLALPTRSYQAPRLSRRRGIGRGYRGVRPCPMPQSEAKLVQKTKAQTQHLVQAN